MLVADDPLEPENHVVAMVKTNLDARPRSVRFHIERDPPGTVKWLGPSDLNADNLLHLPDGKTIPPAVTAAMEFLKWTLWERFRCTWPQLVELAAKEEIAEITVRRARDELKLVKRHIGDHLFNCEPSKEIAAELAKRI
jgi:hypothetical protein